MREVLLFSGGLDSFPAWHYLGKPPALYLDIKHRYREHELQSVQTLAKRCSIDLTIVSDLDLSRYEQDDAIIPLRNVYLSMVASNYGEKIWCVGVLGDYTLDKSPEAFGEFSEFLTKYTGKPIRVDSPYWKMTKSNVVSQYLSDGLPLGDLLATNSCFTPIDGLHCGRCPSCLRRWIAFVNNGVEAEFANDPSTWDRIDDHYIPSMKAVRYPSSRKDELFEALKRIGQEGRI